jgi:hypothetical protein
VVAEDEERTEQVGRASIGGKRRRREEEGPVVYIPRLLATG